MFWPFTYWQASSYQRLRAMGILGMNRRNHSYIARYNPRSLYPLVDDKLKTKRLAQEYDIKTPGLIGVIENQHQVKTFAQLVTGQNGFCVKPCKGSGGKGIVVITQSDGEQYTKANGQSLPPDDLQRHLSNILAGLFSLGGKSDVALIESLIQVDERVQAFTHEGVPDLRVIVFCGFPVMAMMRLSCRSSGGKANLHQGAVGVGIDIRSGRAISAIQAGRFIDQHPDTGQPLHELQVPRWQELLELACSCYDMTGLGYLGVDLVLDKHQGPLLLELNARPGLSIQVANNAGLLPRLRHIEGLKKIERYSLAERVALGRDVFAAQP
jgi:alpha-L-glutamate ligase-like protein